MVKFMKFKNETALAQYVRSYGGNLFQVGGSIRDELLGLEPKDIDYVISGCKDNVLKFTDKVGKSFPVYLVDIGGIKCEVALARTEVKTGDNHTDFKCETENITIEEDLKRRDFTINAIAKNVLTGEIVDPFEGREDLKKGVIRHVSSHFVEDPLRVLRVARFASRFGFDIDEDTQWLCFQLNDYLGNLPTERVWLELEKALSQNHNTSDFFKALFITRSLEVLFKELLDLDVHDKHDGTALVHTLNVIDHGKDKLERFGLLVHDFGKGRTPKEDHPSHHGHDRLGVEPINEFCDRLKVPNKYKKFGLLCAKNHMRMKCAMNMKDGKFLKFVNELGEDFIRVLRVSNIDSAFREGGDRKKESEYMNNVLDRYSLVMRLKSKINGKYLIEQGYNPNSNFQNIINQKIIERMKEI